VLSHGFLMDASMFDAQVAALAPDYRVITLDQRGHGDTPAPGPFSYWDSARECWPCSTTSASSGPSWAPGHLGQLTWPFRALMDRDDITARPGHVHRDRRGAPRANVTHPSAVNAEILDFLRGLPS
jgi:hypothetical protein